MSSEAAADAVDYVLEQWAQERPDLDVSPIGVIGRLHRVGDHLRRALVAEYEHHGLSEGEFDVLATLLRQGDPYVMQPRELASQTMVTTGGMTKRIDRLVTLGLVERVTGSPDARTRPVALTSHGRTLINEAFSAHVRNEQALIAPLARADRDALTDILRRWQHALGE